MKNSEKIFKSNEVVNSDFFWEKCPIKAGSFPIEFFEIVALFARDCGFNLEKLRISRNRLLISGYAIELDDENELMLRFGDNKLSVARVKFVCTRTGNMTRLFEILKNIKKTYNLDEIVIESCNDKAAAWCQKNGLKEHTKYKQSYIERD